MLKSIFTIALAIVAFAAGAQSIDDIRKDFDKKKLDKAKESIDKLTADPNYRSGEGWYLKTQIYDAIAVDDNMKAKVPNAYEIAFDAFKKAMDVDPNNKVILLDAYKSGFIAYEGVAGIAAGAYQANDMAKAFDYYKKTLDYGAYLNQKNLSFGSFSVPKLDTGILFMVGYTAMKLDKTDDAMNYFAKLANARVNKEADYVIPYQFLALEYKKRKDEANFTKYVALGKALYPKDPYFVTIKLDWARENKNYPALFSAYDELIALQPDTLNNYLSYASEIFDYVFTGDNKPADAESYIPKIESNLQKTLGAKYETLSSNLILAQTYYNLGLDIVTESDKLKASTKPDDKKKREDLKAKAIAKYDQAIPYTDKVATELEARGVSTLRASEKVMLRNMYIMLSDMYALKGNKAKADEYDKKYSALK